MVDVADPKQTVIPSVLQQLENQLSHLDLIPEVLLPAVVTHSGGDLDSRCRAISQFREELIHGQPISNPCPWLPVQVQQRLLVKVEESGLARYCYQNEAVTDALILDLLAVLDNSKRHVSSLSLAIGHQLEQKALQSAQKKKQGKKNRKTTALNAAVLKEIQLQAESSAWIQIFASSVPKYWLPAIWQERLAVWQEIESVFTDLGIVSGLGFELSKGVFQSRGWMNLVRLHELVKQLPQLRQVVETLGRMKDAVGKPVIEEIVTLMTISHSQQKELPTPHIPMETKGVTRSNSISRMLPQEAALLAHSTLKKLWHARRAEHALVSYAVEGTEVVIEETEIKQEVKENRAGNKRNKTRGPMAICLDTSGSMAGKPENIAKALVLECLSVAVKEKRRCYIYLFGSTNEVQERELTLTKDGFERLITFLAMSFGGGTDAEGPLNRALDLCKEQEWQNADILLVSDGEFSTSSGLTRKINNRKETQGLFVHGIQIGEYGSAMDRICEPLHRFSEWERLILEREKDV